MNQYFWMPDYWMKRYKEDGMRQVSVFGRCDKLVTIALSKGSLAHGSVKKASRGNGTVVSHCLSGLKFHSYNCVTPFEKAI